MFMSPVISASSRITNDAFGLMPLNALNGSDSNFSTPGDSSPINIPPSYEEATNSVLCGSLAFDTQQRDSKNPSPTYATPKNRQHGSPRTFRMSPTPSRVAPANSHAEEVMLRLATELRGGGGGDSACILRSSTIPRIQCDEIKSKKSPQLQRSQSGPPPAYDEIINIHRSVSSCPSLGRSMNTDFPMSATALSIISAAGVGGFVLAEIEQNSHSKSRERKRMRHVMCGCLVVLLVIGLPVLVVLMTSGSLWVKEPTSHNLGLTTIGPTSPPLPPLPP